MSTARGSLATVLLLALGLTATVANARQPVTSAARPVVARTNTGGGINPGEAARIRFQVQQHHQMQRRANADGMVSPREQSALARDAAQIRHLIQAAKTN